VEVAVVAAETEAAEKKDGINNQVRVNCQRPFERVASSH